MTNQTATEILKNLTPEALGALGLQEVAYVRGIEADGQTVYEVRAADGSAIARFATRDVAYAACRQNDLEPVSVH